MTNETIIKILDKIMSKIRTADDVAEIESYIEGIKDTINYNEHQQPVIPPTNDDLNKLFKDLDITEKHPYNPFPNIMWTNSDRIKVNDIPPGLQPNDIPQGIPLTCCNATKTNN